MSDRICFIGATGKEELLKIEIPERLFGAKENESFPRYEAVRDCILTYIKDIEVYGDRQYAIPRDTGYLKQLQAWAIENSLLIVRDSEIEKTKKEVQDFYNGIGEKFEYNKKHFIGIARITHEGTYRKLERIMVSGLGIGNYEQNESLKQRGYISYKGYTHEDFYNVATKNGQEDYDLFYSVDFDKVFIPCNNELMFIEDTIVKEVIGIEKAKVFDTFKKMQRRRYEKRNERIVKFYREDKSEDIQLWYEIHKHIYYARTSAGEWYSVSDAPYGYCELEGRIKSEITFIMLDKNEHEVARTSNRDIIWS